MVQRRQEILRALLAMNGKAARPIWEAQIGLAEMRTMSGDTLNHKGTRMGIMQAGQDLQELKTCSLLNKVSY